MGFNYLFIFLPCYVALCASKARHRLSSESVSWCLETSLKIPFPGRSSLPTSFVSFFVFYIFSYLFLKTMICFSGYLMSSASIQKLFCGIYWAFKCSFDEFVGEKVVSLSYSSTILRPPPLLVLKEELKTRLGKSLSCARHFSKCFIFTTYIALLGTIFIPILQMRYKEV